MEYPEEETHCSLWQWWRITSELRRRGAGVRESGAFLLGHRKQRKNVIQQAVFYDDIDPNALNTGIVHLSGPALSRVWKICREVDMEVLADVHTHPRGAKQSHSDQHHPMISKMGHVAIILPEYAQRRFSFCRIGVYRYTGSKKWTTSSPPSLRWFSIIF